MKNVFGNEWDLRKLYRSISNELLIKNLKINEFENCENLVHRFLKIILYIFHCALILYVFLKGSIFVREFIQGRALHIERMRQQEEFWIILSNFKVDLHFYLHQFSVTIYKID